MSVKKNIYFAAPFFSEAERDFNQKIVSIIENSNISVFYPPRDGLIAKDKLNIATNWKEISENIWDCDTGAILECQLVLAVTDGRSIDEGVCVEIGFAAAHAKKIIAFSSDDRTQFPWGHNPMVLRPISEFVTSSKDMLKVVRKHLTLNVNSVGNS